VAKQQTAQKYIFKIRSSRLRKAKWNLVLSLSDARRNDEIISIGDSQMMRWIDELNGAEDTEDKVASIRREISRIRNEPTSASNRRAVRSLYAQLDKLQFKPDYMTLVVDKKSDYIRACKGFTINGVEYARLLGTAGGIKCSTIVFVSKRLVGELRRRIDNGRDQTVPLVPAKLEAYRALTCSTSIPVSMPNGVLVVKDFFTRFKEDVIMLSDEDCDEPKMEFVKDFEVEMNGNDGFGLMLPSLAERWSRELKLDYVAGGMNTRCSWEKGMVFCFDFLDFADRVAGSQYMVEDVWGKKVDIRDVELILTESMLKLWSCYDSIDSYLAFCRENRYTFAVTKVCPKRLEDRRTTNYQYLQSYSLSDEQVEELIKPTMDEISDVLVGDINKALLFLRGTELNDRNVEAGGTPNCFSSLLIDEDMFSDPFIRHKLYEQIGKRITDAKIGVLKVHGNYSIVSGDPYALCQSIFGLPVTGLLKAGEIYNKSWVDDGAPEVVAFRAPMSCHNNIRKMRVARGDDVSYWFRYIRTGTIINSWDTMSAALNGMDFDGDLVMLTDNAVLLNNWKKTPTIMCVQRSSQKKIVNEDDLITSNIAGFGDDIGATTNKITAMFDVMAQYAPDTNEYNTLQYRIACGQLFQQNCIDRIKGVVCKPMPKSWYDIHANSLPPDATQTDIDNRNYHIGIMADKKPYFMRYIYPDLNKDYTTYVRKVNQKCLMEHRKTVDELKNELPKDIADGERDFLGYYNRRMPVGDHSCVMNRICHRFEEKFDRQIRLALSDTDFDYTIMKGDTEYTDSQYYSIMQLYKEYKVALREWSQRAATERMDNTDAVDIAAAKAILIDDFRSAAEAYCSNRFQLCDIVLDICYTKEGSKQFAWDLCATEIIQNLLRKHQNIIRYPARCFGGEIEFDGSRFTIKEKESTIWQNIS